MELFILVGEKGEHLLHSIPQTLFKSTCNTPNLFKVVITRTSPCNKDPLTPNFYIVKLGFTGVYMFFLFLPRGVDCGYSLEPPEAVLTCIRSRCLGRE